jgi:CRISPR/Cas system-associated endoribonuclease Cas2
MGKIEKKVRKANIQRIILESIQVAGVLSMLALAPNVLWSMKKLGFKLHKRQSESIKRARQTLIKRQFIKLTGDSLKITQSGKAYLLKCLLLGEDKKLNVNKKWDKKWRVLIFDIPESRKSDRALIRRSLISIGFVKLQNSVWVYPYDCENIISLIKADAEIEDSMLYMIVEAIESDEHLKKHFNLN